ncbi:MAG: peptidylprolyl isomerase, partial [Clostridia bacterium]|nr:peptidylprolyl isomerase [Clostridia bacterium]
MSEKILATIAGLTVTEGDVDKFIAGLGQRGAAYNSPEGRRAVLNQIVNHKLLLLDAQRNLYEAEATFRARLAQLKEELLIDYAAEKVLSQVNVSDKDLETYYEENKDKFMTEEGVNASHILVDTEEKALEILASIKAGEVTFEEAASQHSSCPSGKSGGNLGDFGRGQMVPEFDTAVFEMQVGEVTETPVKTQFGYHLIKLN